MTEYSELDALRISRGFPEGVTPGSDTSSLVTGVLIGLDADNARVQVVVGDSGGVWVPAVPGIYGNGSRVRLLRSVMDGGRMTVCLGPLDPAPEVVQGRVVAVNAGTSSLTVQSLGETWELPYAAGSYAVSTLVHVLRSPQRFGDPYFVLGVQGNFRGAEPGGAGSGVVNPPALVQKQKVILPVDSGTWSSSKGAWDRWNTDRYGGPSTLWQGNAFGSGPLVGWAGYGDQLVNLGAVSIDLMQVAVYKANNNDANTEVPVLQPAVEGTRPAGAPTPSGLTVAGPPLRYGDGGAWVTLPAGTYPFFNSGATKGIATVGTDHAGFSGLSKGDGMALSILYTVTE